ncbi:MULTISPECIES: hypothetical protein [Bacillaceae]|uniref:hypothetical protein n=1 Tax=Bacillaceae TaxID=186817 RepID=UPI000369694C|nr:MULTISPECIES: hypothetical protein [Bacillaceae]
MKPPSVISSKWRILPQYVTFEEAMIAYREGKIIVSYLEEDEGDRYADYSINRKNHEE